MLALIQPSSFSICFILSVLQTSPEPLYILGLFTLLTLCQAGTRPLKNVVRFQLIRSLCLSSCCWAFRSSLQTQFLAPSVIPRNSNETSLAKKTMTSAVPSAREFVQPPNGIETYLLFSTRYPSVLLPGYPLEWVLRAGSTYKQVADWRSVGELVKKKNPSRLHCLSSPHHLAEGNTVSVKVKYSLLLFHSHLFVEARTLCFYSNQQSLCYIVVFLKEGANYGILCGHSSHLTLGTLHC